MKILLTGGSGFIGNNLKDYLSKDYDVYEIRRKKTKNKRINKVFYYDGEIKKLLNFFKSTKPDIVVHLASLFISEHNSLNVTNLVKDNILFSTQLLECCIQSGCKKFLNTGTSWQNFKNKEYNPVNLYSATKEAFFDIIYYYHLAHNVDCINLKLFDTYGPKDKRKKLFYHINLAVKKKKSFDMTLGNQKINILHVNDICNGFLIAINLLMKKDKVFKTYALSANKLITLKALVKKYLEINNLALKVNWGKKNFKKREVMLPWTKFELLPGWKQLIKLERGLKIK